MGQDSQGDLLYVLYFQLVVKACYHSGKKPTQISKTTVTLKNFINSAGAFSEEGLQEQKTQIRSTRPMTSKLIKCGVKFNIDDDFCSLWGNDFVKMIWLKLVSCLMGVASSPFL